MNAKILSMGISHFEKKNRLGLGSLLKIRKLGSARLVRQKAQLGSACQKVGLEASIIKMKNFDPYIAIKFIHF